jgi:TonB family protein
MVGIPLLVVLLGGGAWFMMSSGGASGESGSSYAQYRSRADSLYQNEQYRQARRAYRQALQQREDDQYVQQRLDQIEEAMASSSERQYERSLARGDSLKSRADSLFSEGNTDDANTVYSRAMAAYFSALDARSGDEVANRKIDQVERRQETIAKQQASGSGGSVNTEQIAGFFKKQAESQLESGNLEAALRKYKQAADYSENSKSLDKVIADLEQEIKEQERNEKYEDAIARGERMMRENNYSEAQKAFQNALDVKSTSEARDALARAEKLSQERKQTQQQYKQYRSQGDEAYQQGNYEKAIEAYKQALKTKPNDSYAEEQLEKAQQELEEIRLAQAKQTENKERKENMVGPDGIYKVVDQDAKVKGGLGALHEDVEYPETAARRGIEGRVYVQAVVNADGTVRSAEVARGIGGGCDREAIRVVEDAEFIPAKVDGKPVPSRTTVWIQFSLSGQG